MRSLFYILIYYINKIKKEEKSILFSLFLLIFIIKEGGGVPNLVFLSSFCTDGLVTYGNI